MKHVVVIYPQGEVELQAAKDLSLKQLQDIVGGYIELVVPRDLPHRLSLVVDEEGICKDSPPNLVATRLQGSLLVGKVAVVGIQGDELVGMDEESAKLVCRLARLAGGCIV